MYKPDPSVGFLGDFTVTVRFLSLKTMVPSWSEHVYAQEENYQNTGAAVTIANDGSADATATDFGGFQIR
jgi:hypothetical protein